MATSDRRRDTSRAGQLAPPRPGADREIELSRTVEASMADGTTRARGDAYEPHATHDPKGASRVYERPGRGTHVALVLGALLMFAVPWMLRAALARSGDASLGAAAPSPFDIALLLVVAVSGGLLVSRRLRRSISPSRRTAYMAGAWMLALGGGLVASRLDPALGARVSYFGTLGLFALLYTDSVLRRRGRGEG